MSESTSEDKAIATSLIESLDKRGSAVLNGSKPGAHFAIHDSYGRTRMYFRLGTSQDEKTRVAVQNLAAEFGLKCQKVRGTDGFESLELDVSEFRDNLSRIVEQTLVRICEIEI